MKPDLKPLAEQIRGGGSLAEWFQRAAQSARERATRMGDDLSPRGKMEGAHAGAHAVLDEGIAQSPLALLRECRAGCCACCLSVPVDVTPLEALTIAEHLRQTLDAKQFAKTRDRLVRVAEIRREARRQPPITSRAACALLSADGLCTVYEVRPLACAGFFSLSRAACEDAYQQGGIAAAVPTDRPAKAWTMGVSGGLQHALVEAGLDGNLYELNSAVLCAFDTPRAAERWLAGEDVFADCLCTDAHSPPRAAAKAA